MHSYHQLMIYILYIVIIVCTTLCMDTTQNATGWMDLALPEEHIPFFFTNNPEVRKRCRDDPECPYKRHLDESKCWGYEAKCHEKQRMHSAKCDLEATRGWHAKVKSEEAQQAQFWREADFGYIKQRKQELTVLCQPQEPDDSYFACTDHMRFCRAKNIFLNFTSSSLKKNNDRYMPDVFLPGELGGHCIMDEEKLAANCDHRHSLQSWSSELENYRALDFKPSMSEKCDVIIDKPTILMKLDAGVNMYHHFCDYFNLYLSQHINNSFSMDLNIIMWDMSGYGYGDLFKDTWKAFTNHNITHLKEYRGKTICIKEAIFPLLPRMALGLYYSTPIIPGCVGSSMFRAFSQHVLYRLNRTQEGPLERKIRITLLSRTTKFRKIINQAELVDAMRAVDKYEVNVVDYKKAYPFLDQLQTTHNIDIFIGMHGAGLAHSLFLPDWAVLFEVYHCGDRRCYNDLARLRGVHYMTWEDEDTLTKHDPEGGETEHSRLKFIDYSFDKDEFLRRIAEAVEYVENNKSFIQARKQKYGHVDSSQAKPKTEL